MNKMDKIYVVLRVILGFVFIYASIDKILHPAEFSEAVYNYQILPDQLINLTAIILPYLELIAGLLLVFGKWLHGSLFTINVLLLVFIGALFFNLSRGLNIHCGCFSTTVQSIEKGSLIWILLRDFAFFLTAMFLWIYYYRMEVRKNSGCLE